MAVFFASAIAAAALEGTRKSETGSAVGNRDFLKFRNNYVLVYALMMGKAICAYLQHISTLYSIRST